MTHIFNIRNAPLYINTIFENIAKSLLSGFPIPFKKEEGRFYNLSNFPVGLCPGDSCVCRRVYGAVIMHRNAIKRGDLDKVLIRERRKMERETDPEVKNFLVERLKIIETGEMPYD